MTDRHGERWAKATRRGLVADALDAATAEVEADQGNTLTLKMGKRGTWTENLPGPCSDADLREACERLFERAWPCSAEHIFKAGMVWGKDRRK